MRRFCGAEATVAKRARGWLGWLGEVFGALLADPVLIVPAVLVIILAVLGAMAAWRLM